MKNLRKRITPDNNSMIWERLSRFKKHSLFPERSTEGSTFSWDRLLNLNDVAEFEEKFTSCVKFRPSRLNLVFYWVRVRNSFYPNTHTATDVLSINQLQILVCSFSSILIDLSNIQYIIMHHYVSYLPKIPACCLLLMNFYSAVTCFSSCLVFFSPTAKTVTCFFKYIFYIWS